MCVYWCVEYNVLLELRTLIDDHYAFYTLN